MNENNETALIVIETLPQIADNLKALKESWEQRAADAAAMVCTEDTVQSLKTMRAEITKEFKAADAQRIAVKKRYMEPWDAIEATFKECVKDAYTRADDALKAQINSFESELKASCEADLRVFFNELIITAQVDCLSFEKAMEIGKIKISLTDAKKATPRQLQDKLGEVVAKVSMDLDMIQKMDDSALIMVEYKKSFDVGQAVGTVQARKRQEQAEKEAAERRRAAQEAQSAAVSKVEAAAPITAPVTAPAKAKSPDDVFPEFTFTVYGATRAQLIRLRDFMKQEGIQYK